MDAAGKFVRVSMEDRTKNALIEETIAEIGENTLLIKCHRSMRKHCLAWA